MTKLLSSKQAQTCKQTFSQGVFHLHMVDLDRLEKEIHGQEEHVAQSHLSPMEQDRFFAFTYRKRQLEWLGGRIAAKNSISELLLAKGHNTPLFTDLQIDSAPDGRPFLNAKHITIPIDISISHSSNRATAMAVADGLCGIDIQKITPKITKVKSRFVTQEEEQLLLSFLDRKTDTMETALTLIWAAKEAFRKSLPSKPILGFLEVRLEEIRGTINDGLVAIFQCSRRGLPVQIKAFCSLSGSLATAINIHK